MGLASSGGETKFLKHKLYVILRALSAMKKNKAGKEIKEYKAVVWFKIEWSQRASLRKWYLSKGLNGALKQGAQISGRTFQAKEEQALKPDTGMCLKYSGEYKEVNMWRVRGEMGGGKGRKQQEPSWGKPWEPLKDSGYCHQVMEQRNDTSDSHLKGLIWMFVEDRQMGTSIETKTS